MFRGFRWSEWQDLNLRPPRPERGAFQLLGRLGGRNARRRDSMMLPSRSSSFTAKQGFESLAPTLRECPSEICRLLPPALPGPNVREDCSVVITSTLLKAWVGGDGPETPTSCHSDHHLAQITTFTGTDCGTVLLGACRSIATHHGMIASSSRSSAARRWRGRSAASDASDWLSQRCIEGFFEGRNVAIEYRWAESYMNRKFRSQKSRTFPSAVATL